MDCKSGGTTPSPYYLRDETLKLKSRMSFSCGLHGSAAHALSCSHHEAELVRLDQQMQQETQTRQHAIQQATQLKRELDGPITVRMIH